MSVSIALSGELSNEPVDVRELGDSLPLLGYAFSAAIGDTYIDSSMTPQEQWTRIITMLAAHGIRATLVSHIP